MKPSHARSARPYAEMIRRRKAVVWMDDFSYSSQEAELELCKAVEKGLPPGAEAWPPERGGGPSAKEIHQVIEIAYVSLAAGVSAKLMFGPVIKWMVKRFQKSKAPKRVQFIYGPTGDVIASITMRSKDDMPRIWRRLRPLNKRRKPRRRRM